MTIQPYRVETFGQDCLGNVTGWRVVTGSGAFWVCRHQFVGDIYQPEERTKAKADAEAMCRRANAAAFVEAVATAETLHTCENGHRECSTHEGGPCLDAVLSEYPDLDNS